MMPFALGLGAERRFKGELEQEWRMEEERRRVANQLINWCRC